MELTDGAFTELPASRQDPGKVHVEEPQLEAGVDQRVVVVVCGEHHVGSDWEAWGHKDWITLENKL